MSDEEFQKTMNRLGREFHNHLLRELRQAVCKNDPPLPIAKVRKLLAILEEKEPPHDA